MFVQTSKTTINGKTYECKTVRESYRTDKGPRSRTVCNISKLPAHRAAFPLRSISLTSPHALRTSLAAQVSSKSLARCDGS